MMPGELIEPAPGPDDRTELVMSRHAKKARQHRPPAPAAPAPTAPLPAAPAALPVPRDPPRLWEQDDYLFNEGRHYRLYDKLGAHPVRRDGVDGVDFAVWAPSAEYVAVIGDFNDWDAGRHALRPQVGSGIW